MSRITEAQERIANFVAKNAEVYAKIQKKLTRMRKMERLRVLSGLPQKTRLNIKTYSTKITRSTWHLMTRYGYIRTDDPYLVWYDKNTRRTKDEDYWFRTYKIRIEPIPEEYDETTEQGEMES